MLRISLLLPFFAALPAFAQTGLSEKTGQLFDWFDTLGFEDVSNAKIVRVCTGSDGRNDNITWEDASDECVGFLLADNGATFRVVLADLTVSEMIRQGTEESAEDFCGCREISLKAEARRLLQELRDPAYFRRWEESGRFHHYDFLPRWAQVFVFARACALHGEVELAESLIRMLENHPARDERPSRDGPINEVLPIEFSILAAAQLRLSLRDPAETWATLRDRAKKLQEVFSNEQFVDLAKTFAGLADEEVEHARTAPASLDGLTPREKARELTWRLRDEQDPNPDNDHWPRPWPFKPRESNGAMAGLRELGLEAVPALLEEARSGRMSRSITRDANSPRGGMVLVAGTNELAVSVLKEIMGVSFSGGDVAAFEDRWRTIEPKGEKQWLIEMVQQGGDEANACVERLRTKYPEVFLETMLAAARTSTSPHNRAKLTKKLWKERDPKVDDFLRDELRKGPTLGNRVAAAYGLRQHGIAEGEKAICEEWTHLVKQGLENEEIFVNPREEAFNDDNPLPGEAPAHALKFLIAGDAVESFHLLLRTLRELPVQARVALIGGIGERNFNAETPTKQRASPATRMLIREILLSALDDTTPTTKGTEPFEGDSFCPRLCDLAAMYLHARWPEKFTFDVFASESIHERQRIAMLNIHRREQDLAELPLPVGRPKVAAAKANHVAAIEWEANSAIPSAAFLRKLTDWKGRPLDLAALVTMLTSYAKAPHAGTRGLRFTAFRDGDSTGVVVRLRLRTAELGNKDLRITSAFVAANGEVSHSSGSSGPANSAMKRSEWTEFSQNAARAIAMPVDKMFIIRADVSWLP